MKKLIPALCMLLVAAALLGTSTYAWFSMNNTVTATGMNVKATTTDSLAISDAQGGTFGETMTLATMSSTVMNPVTALAADATSQYSVGTEANKTDKTLTTISFYGLNAANNKVNNPNDAAATKTLAQAITDNKVGDYFTEANAADYVTDDMWLLYTGEAGAKKAVNLGIEVTGTKSTIDKALHVAFLVDGKWYNYDLTSFTSGSTAYTHVVENFVELTSGAAKKISVYVWYEGEDTDCKTANAVATNGLTVNLKWSTTAISYS